MAEQELNSGQPQPEVQNQASPNTANQGSNMSTSSIVYKTMPYFLLRALVYTGVVLGFIIFSIIWVGAMNLLNSLNMPVFQVISGILLFIILLTCWRFLKSYILYMIKAGHIAVVSELVNGNSIPEGQGQISYGASMVKKYFMTANVMYVMDNLVNKVIQDIKNNMDRITSHIPLPGIELVESYFEIFVDVFLGYADEAVFGYIFQSNTNNVWKTAADGVVLYAQNWKELIKSAGKMSLALFGIILGGIVAAYGGFLATSALGLNSIVISVVVIGILMLAKLIFVDPIVMIFMINRYLSVTKGQQPSIDLYSKLQSISKKFSKIINKSNETATATVAPTAIQ